MGWMPYKTLSQQLQELPDPQRSDAFVKRFREAVREGRIEAAELPERFTLPKQFRRRGGEEGYQRQGREMVFEVTPEVEGWLEQTAQELATAPRRGRGQPKPSVEAIESGEVDFKALAARTREKMQASFEKGQALGQSRGQAKKPAAKKAPAKGGRRKTSA